MGSATDVSDPATTAREYLKNCGVERVLLVDDAFDPVTRADIEERIGEFWDRIIRDQALQGELRSKLPSIEDADDIDDAALKTLFELRSELPSVGPLCEQILFADKLQKMSDLDTLKAFLGDLRIPVDQVGSNQELPPGPFRLVFLDYMLGLDEATAVRNARNKAEQIYQSAGRDEDKPFIVLMSSKPNAADSKDLFRDSSGLLSGLFAFVPKSALSNRDEINAQLSAWAIGMPTGHTIQRFVEALATSVDDASKEFKRRIRALGVEDYANIQWLSLQPDGHPLGDYLLWLYKSLLAHLLHNNPAVIAEQKKLDEMSFKEYTPTQSAPSLDLADVYKCALTDPGIEAVGPHPRSEPGSTEPYLSLGDLFFRDGASAVYVVLNAACDLAYSPGTSRPFPKDTFILLLRGELQRFDHPAPGTGGCTELFKHDGHVYRINWSFKRAQWKEYSAVWTWLRENSYVRRERLALPFALELQRAFTANFSRIGMPVRPRLRTAALEVFCSGAEGQWEQLIEPVRDGVRVVTQKQSEEEQEVEEFALTFDAISAVSVGLAKLAVILRGRETKLQEKIQAGAGLTDMESKRAQTVSEGKLKGLGKQLERLGALGQVSSNWLPLVRRLHPLPKQGAVEKLSSDLLWVYRDHTFTGSYKAGPPVVLHVRTANPEPAVKRSDSSATQVCNEVKDDE